LACTLTRRTRPADSKKSLLIVQLAAAFARFAGGHAGARLRAGALAKRAQILPRNPNLRRQAERSLFKRQPHVVTQIRAALRTPSRPARASENFLEAEEIPENILKFFVDVLVEACSAFARNSGVAKSIVGAAFTRIGQNRVGFRRFPKLL